MCGIYCRLSCRKSTENQTNFEADTCEYTCELLANRGPNTFAQHSIATRTFDIVFRGYVLWQQGSRPCNQPLVNGDHVLLLNGDIYTQRPNREQSDTEWLMEQIAACKNEEEFIALFTTIVAGPFSIIYYNSRTECLYFVRDSLGRQSLLFGYNQGDLVITSVVAKSTRAHVELPPLGIFKWEHTDDTTTISLYPWQDISIHKLYTDQLAELQEFIGIDVTINASVRPDWLQNANEAPCWTFDALPKDYESLSPDEIFTAYLSNANIRFTCDRINDILSRSVKERCENTPLCCKSCFDLKSVDHSGCVHPKIGILFSGGLDCTVLAVLADRYIPQSSAIDLLNVSFEKVRRSTAEKHERINYETPDRVSARETLEELRIFCPKRQWNLVEVNVTRAELQAALQERISHLVYPLFTVLDESLGAALWFAASGKGRVNDLPYNCPSRVLLIGSGADELFGGYTRHRNAFVRNGSSWKHLADELHLDWVRLPSRNLARDDRVIGDWGITARSPYVHEELVHAVRNLDTSQKCMHLLDQGVGDKLLLRLAAYQLGLRGVCSLRKRALQFGSRIADSRQNAKNKSIALE